MFIPWGFRKSKLYICNILKSRNLSDGMQLWSPGLRKAEGEQWYFLNEFNFLVCSCRLKDKVLWNTRTFTPRRPRFRAVIHSVFIVLVSYKAFLVTKRPCTPVTLVTLRLFFMDPHVSFKDTNISQLTSAFRTITAPLVSMNFDVTRNVSLS